MPNQLFPPLNGGSGGSGGRELLTANRTYFVRTDGSDSNTGLTNTSGGAFLTIQKAIDVAASLDFAIYNVTIQIADGTYTSPNLLKSFVGAGKLIIRGNASAPSNVVISVSTAALHCFYFLGQTQGIVRIQDMRLQTSGSAECCLDQSLGYGYMEFENVVFGSAVIGHIRIGAAGICFSTGNYTIAGGSLNHAAVYDGGFIRLGTTGSPTITITGTPNFSVCTMTASRGGKILTVNQNYSGTATGNRYVVDTSGLITKVGGSADLPGSIAGTPVANPTEAQVHTATYGYYVSA